MRQGKPEEGEFLTLSSHDLLTLKAHPQQLQGGSWNQAPMDFLTLPEHQGIHRKQVSFNLCCICGNISICGNNLLNPTSNPQDCQQYLCLSIPALHLPTPKNRKIGNLNRHEMLHASTPASKWLLFWGGGNKDQWPRSYVLSQIYALKIKARPVLFMWENRTLSLTKK